MQPKIQTWIYQQSAFAGVECVQQGDDFYYNLCILKKEKDNATIVLQKEQIPSIAILKEQLEDDMPIFLAVNIKGMLHRQLDYPPKDDLEALSALFPSAKAEDFYVQHIPSGNQHFVSVVRQDTLNQLLNQLTTEGLWIVNAFLGSFWMAEVLPILPPLQELQGAQLLLQIEQQEIVGFRKQIAVGQARLALGNDMVQEPLVLALSMAFLGITQPSIQGIAAPIIEQQQSNFYYKKLFHYTSIAALGFFFMALLGNYLLFDHYNQQQQSLQMEVNQQRSLLVQRDSLAEKYANKRALLGDQLYLGESKTSFYADQLAASLPSTLQLTSLVLFPLIKERNFNPEEQLPRYSNQTIIVSGTCQASVFYNNWKRAIKELDWVKSIHNLSYQNAANGQGMFELEIRLADD